MSDAPTRSNRIENPSHTDPEEEGTGCERWMCFIMLLEKYNELLRDSCPIGVSGFLSALEPPKSHPRINAKETTQDNN